MRRLIAISAAFLSAVMQAAPQFEVASVKPSAPVRSENACRAPRADPAGLDITGCTLKFLISWAYDRNRGDIEGGPDWLDSMDNRYDLMAKSGSPATVDQERAMLQMLLADRFHLQVKQETKERPVFALTLAKGGSKLKEVEPGTALHGQIRFRMSGQTMILTGTKAPVSELTVWMRSLLLNTGRNVVDQTGLSGAYDFKLE